MVVVGMAMEEEEMELNQWLTSKRYATDTFHDTASVDGDLLCNDDDDDNNNYSKKNGKKLKKDKQTCSYV
jgi:hypothetical protein